MQAVVCPYCRIRVVPSAEGICPGCRRDVSRVVPAEAEIIQPEHSPGPSVTTCPGCNASLPPGAVLCVACGYHLPTGSYLSTSVERRPTANPFAGVPGSRGFSAAAPNSNPYVSPSIVAGQQVTPELVSELPPWALRKAEAIASDAEMLRWTIVLGICFCFPALLAMFPWYGFRLFSWYQLNSLYDELREPNGFSPHCDVGVRFQDAFIRLWAGTILGAFFWVIFGLIVLVQLAIGPHR